MYRIYYFYQKYFESQYDHFLFTLQLDSFAELWKHNCYKISVTFFDNVLL